ncbi:MAG: 4Fe-4S binding protein, partial [Planctomycetota bacterium]|nr:4Fe-4S binding protein [Planctomycetota bacterium]
LCGLGQTAPNPVISTLRYFWDEYEAHLRDKFCPSGVCKGLFRYEIDIEKCTGCGVCLKNCPVSARGAPTGDRLSVGSASGGKAIAGEKKKPHTIDTAICELCGICVEKCKFNAIVPKPRLNDTRKA